jgi:hypothetical protein
MDYKTSVPVSKWKIITSRKGILTGIIIISLLCCILLGLYAAGLKHKEERTLKVLTEQVKPYDKEENAKEALERIKEFVKEHPGFKTHEKVREMENKFQKRLVRYELKEKQYRFIKAVMKNDDDEILKLINPEILRRIDRDVICSRVKIASIFLNWKGITPEDFRISEIEIDEEMENAIVRMEVILKTPSGITERRPLHPYRWKRIKNEWFLDLELFRSTPQRKF